MKKYCTPNQEVASYPVPYILARDFLAATPEYRQSNVDFVSLSKRIGQMALQGHGAEIPMDTNRHLVHLYPQLLYQGKYGQQIVEPVVMNDGTLLMNIRPEGSLALLKKGKLVPLPDSILPFPVHFKEMHNGICYLLERNGARICALDERLNVLGITEALNRVGMDRPTSFCFFENRIGVISWPNKEVWIFDVNWNPIVLKRFPWVDFLFHPIAVGSTIIAVDTPSSSQGSGGLVGIGADGEAFSLYDGLVSPLGLCTYDNLLVSGHANGLSFLKYNNYSQIVLLGTFDIRNICDMHEKDRFVTVTYVLVRGKSLVISCDILTAGISGPGRTFIFEISINECLKELGIQHL
jgi:hypothetical protein